MEEDKSYQGWSANAEQLRRTAQQIHRTLKNDLKSLNTGMSYQCSLAKDEAIQKQNACWSYFERKEHSKMTEETCYMHSKMLLKLGTGNGERGTRNRSLGTSLQRLSAWDVRSCGSTDFCRTRHSTTCQRRAAAYISAAYHNVLKPCCCTHFSCIVEAFLCLWSLKFFWGPSNLLESETLL